jgi:hypothetical protein
MNYRTNNPAFEPAEKTSWANIGNQEEYQVVQSGQNCEWTYWGLVLVARALCEVADAIRAPK